MKDFLALLQFLPTEVMAGMGYVVLGALLIIAPLFAVSYLMKKERELTREQMAMRDQDSVYMKEKVEGMSNRIDLLMKQNSFVLEKLSDNGCQNAPFCQNRLRIDIPRFGAFCKDCDLESCADCPAEIEILTK